MRFLAERTQFRRDRVVVPIARKHLLPDPLFFRCIFSGRSRGVNGTTRFVGLRQAVQLCRFGTSLWDQRVGWRPSITRHLLTLGGDVHRSSLAHRIMHITAPRPRGFDHGPGLAIGSGQEVVQWPIVTLARKRQNCGYDQGTGSGVFQVGQGGDRLNQRQPAVPVLGGLLAYPCSRLPTRALLFHAAMMLATPKGLAASSNRHLNR